MIENPMHNKVIILGAPVDNLTMAETLDAIERFIEVGRATSKTHQVATINADFITNALGDPEQMAILQNADLNMPDGMPIVWSARLLGTPMQERVAGVDAVMQLAERAAQKGYSIYFLGAAPGVAARAVEIIHSRYPGMRVAGVSSPMVPATLTTDAQVLEDIRASQPDILLVAFGNPKQEKWIAAYRGQLQTPVMIGVGGTLDLISGDKVRAPGWMRRSGLEWTFRLAQEPKRLWRRYGRNIFVFLPQVARQWWAMRARPQAADLFEREDVQWVGEEHVAGDVAVISLSGSLSIANVADFERRLQATLAETPNIGIDCSQVKFLDSTALGALVRTAQQARRQGGDLVLASATEKLVHVLHLLRLDTFFCIYPDLESGLLAIQPRHSVERGIAQQPAILYPNHAVVQN